MNVAVGTIGAVSTGFTPLPTRTWAVSACPSRLYEPPLLRIHWYPDPKRLPP